MKKYLPLLHLKKIILLKAIISQKSLKIFLEKNYQNKILINMEGIF